MAHAYHQAMDVLYRVSMWIAGIALLAMVTVIPIGIFSRYVLNEGAAWPEPIAILCMVTFTFIGAAVSYRAGSHIAVNMLIDRLSPALQSLCARLADLLMVVIFLFIIYYGYALCSQLWLQPVAEFPLLTAGQAYLPLPIGSAVTLLFVIERLLFGSQHHRPVVLLGNT
ncbi:TRAP transporter small permease [Serratia odorifera]|uniref:TRAP transporter small permease protein n=2 Tax=Serratia odorifera TaxID=618 RepID=D4E0U6_SEROD|nr:TRAP transporter small permease [Serratia odorifera]EFE96549.1 TRAP transporter, DctQ-like membrane protein [Serratia odorifera DSM 4582]PNK90967.1 TRAP transporter small permease [Serratia odorifera]RII72212.1 TRAP transporter small permease [Serratia odorifera]VDZ57411.1 2,3-diketo-L-gulonate TRAP transporter small permease protein YiaM [Serratia odorifera]